MRRSFYLNCMKLLVESAGMVFTVSEEPFAKANSLVLGIGRPIIRFSPHCVHQAYASNDFSHLF